MDKKEVEQILENHSPLWVSITNPMHPAYPGRYTCAFDGKPFPCDAEKLGCALLTRMKLEEVLNV